MQIETIRAVRDLLTVMQRRDQIPAVRALVESYITDDHLADLDRAIRKYREPVTFNYAMPGYVLIGQGKDVRPVHDPDLCGLRFANEVFGHGIASASILRSQDWGMKPNALRNALLRASEWAAPHCAALAVAIYEIEVSKEGRPTYPGEIEVRVF